MSGSKPKSPLYKRSIPRIHLYTHTQRENVHIYINPIIDCGSLLIRNLNELMRQTAIASYIWRSRRLLKPLRAFIDSCKWRTNDMMASECDVAVREFVCVYSSIIMYSCKYRELCLVYLLIVAEYFNIAMQINVCSLVCNLF